MHDLDGHSHMFDHVHQVYLSHRVQLQVTPEAARLLIGPASGNGVPETVLFTRPASISTLSIVAQVLEEQGTLAANGGMVVVPKRSPTWTVCPDCLRQGGDYDNDDNWYACDACGGAGLVRIRS